jgi:hypothetical protein
MRVIIFLLFAICLVSSETYAAPYPAAGSSALVSIDKGLFLLTKGFSVRAKSPEWALQNSGDNEETAIYRLQRKNSDTAILALRSEVLKTELSLEAYAKRWMKDYTNYGFDLLGTKPFRQNQQSRGLVVDLFHKKSDQQLRQVLFMRGKRVVIFTCKDTKKNFTSTLESCNEVAKSFQWSNLNHQKSF